MSQAVFPPSVTFAEYVRREAEATEKHQLIDGEIFSMAGGTPEHALISMNVGSELRALIGRGPCKVYSSDLRIGVAATGLVTYPDVTVVCGELQRHGEDKNTILNPTVIIEVLSESTEAFDRGRKFSHYKRIPSLAAYVLVSQSEVCVEVFQRAEGGRWTVDEVRSGSSAAASARIDVLEASLQLSLVYAGVFGTTSKA
jgi:Uma2 family endonuclease